MKILRYTAEKEKEWNAFLEKAKNTTFLFNRGFMDYHSDRFRDHSLMVYNDKENLVACFPANETEDKTIHSHQGLTYGSLVFQKELKLPSVMEIFKAILGYYAGLGHRKIRYKAFPRFYNDAQTDEVEYCLFINNAKLYRRDTAIAIDQKNPLKYQTRRKRSIKTAVKKGVVIDKKENIQLFWDEILTPNLQERFGVDPVHSLEEIQLLKTRFPENIISKTTSLNGKIMAGSLLFITNSVVHAQYISASDEGRENGSLDFLFDEIIKEYNQFRYFDFGICNENQGRDLNEGLLDWKEGFGGRAYSHDFYEIEL